DGSDIKTATEKNIFVTRINADGSYGWTRWMEGTGGNADYGEAIAVDDSANIYVTGHFGGTVDFAALFGGLDSKNATFNDVFVTRINADGSYGWTRQIGGSSTYNGCGVAVDNIGNIYVTGPFSSTVNFAADFGGSDFKTSAGFDDIFVTRINADGSYGWTRRMGAASFDNGLGIAVDGSGSVYITGSFAKTVDFAEGFGGSDSKTSAGSGDVFVTRINDNGSYGWTRRMGAGSGDRGYGIAVDGSG
ncbi:MAG: hypothetical protein GY869_25305, partial [Planctomycetes bacterium]|nr:hypothetical protein [Planctomycetota bacterium]